METPAAQGTASRSRQSPGYDFLMPFALTRDRRSPVIRRNCRPKPIGRGVRLSPSMLEQLD